jgi:hypothetical protein
MTHSYSSLCCVIKTTCCCGFPSMEQRMNKVGDLWGTENIFPHLLDYKLRWQATWCTKIHFLFVWHSHDCHRGHIITWMVIALLHCNSKQGMPTSESWTLGVYRGRFSLLWSPLATVHAAATLPGVHVKHPHFLCIDLFHLYLTKLASREQVLIYNCDLAKIKQSSATETTTQSYME